MATELSRELFPDDISWFLQDMERETIDEVDKLIRQIEVNTDGQPLSSTQQADSAFALKTCKGEDYEPDSLCMMLGALNCHLRDSGCAHRINDEQFLGAKRVLKGKAIDLREKSKGKKEKEGRSNYRRRRGANVGSKSTWV